MAIRGPGRLRSFLRDMRGATAIEYGLIAALIAIGGAFAFKSLGDTVTARFNGIAAAITSAGGASGDAGGRESGVAVRKRVDDRN